MPDLGWSGTLARRPPQGDRWNGLRYSFPNSSVAAGANEEIEIETGLDFSSLEAFIFAGATFSASVLQHFFDGFSSVVGDDDDILEVTYSSRTGNFDLEDPEYITGYSWLWGVAETATDASGIALGAPGHTFVPDEGLMLVSPVLVHRFLNLVAGDTVTADSLGAKIYWETVRLRNRELLIELLEQQADFLFF